MAGAGISPVRLTLARLGAAGRHAPLGTSGHPSTREAPSLEAHAAPSIAREARTTCGRAVLTRRAHRPRTLARIPRTSSRAPAAHTGTHSANPSSRAPSAHTGTARHNASSEFQRLDDQIAQNHRVARYCNKACRRANVYFMTTSGTAAARRARAGGRAVAHDVHVARARPRARKIARRATRRTCSRHSPFVEVPEGTGWELTSETFDSERACCSRPSRSRIPPTRCRARRRGWPSAPCSRSLTRPCTH